MSTEQIIYVHEYVSDHQTFEAMKAKQLEFQKEIRTLRLEYKSNQRNSLPANITPLRLSRREARLHNVAYGLVRGKTYARIESNLRQTDEHGREATLPITRAQLEKYFISFPGVDQSKINWEGLK